MGLAHVPCMPPVLKLPSLASDGMGVRDCVCVCVCGCVAWRAAGLPGPDPLADCPASANNMSHPQHFHAYERPRLQQHPGCYATVSHATSTCVALTQLVPLLWASVADAGAASAAAIGRLLPKGPPGLNIGLDRMKALRAALHYASAMQRVLAQAVDRAGDARLDATGTVEAELLYRAAVTQIIHAAKGVNDGWARYDGLVKDAVKFVADKQRDGGELGFCLGECLGRPPARRRGGGPWWGYGCRGSCAPHYHRHTQSVGFPRGATVMCMTVTVVQKVQQGVKMQNLKSDSDVSAQNCHYRTSSTVTVL